MIVFVMHSWVWYQAIGMARSSYVFCHGLLAGSLASQHMNSSYASDYDYDYDYIQGWGWEACTLIITLIIMKYKSEVIK